jgi:nitrile hydratase
VEGAHDLGGIGGFGPVRTADGELTHHEPWELRAQVLAFAACRGARPWIEGLDPATYLTTTYYGRWLLAAERAAVSKAIVSSDVLADWQRRVGSGEATPVIRDDALRARQEQAMLVPVPMTPALDPSFALGDTVRVKRIYEPDRVHRIPRYVRGVLGTIETICGEDHLAGYRDYDVEPFYTVRFNSGDVWGERDDETPFVIHVDLWQSYLQEAPAT